jgi:hypothetical protein
MTHLKQHGFNSAGVCISCGADLEDADLPCDYPLQSAPDYFDRDDPRWQAEESEIALRLATPDHLRRNHAGRSR